MASRGLVVAGARFNPTAWKKSVYAAVEQGVTVALNKAYESAVEDAPVRDVFKHGTALRRRGLRTRPLTRIEAFSEIPIRQQITYRNKAGEIVPLASAVPGVSRTRGRGGGEDEPYLRRAAIRKGNPNAMEPWMRQRGPGREGMLVQNPLARNVAKNDRGERFLAEFPDAAVARKGGRTGYEHSPLHARGRYELRSGRAVFSKGGEMTLGGRLRREIKKQGPHRMGHIIKGQVLSPTPYAKFQEFGTRHNRATPYLRPAILKQLTTFRRDMVKAINRSTTTTPISRISPGPGADWG